MDGGASVEFSTWELRIQLIIGESSMTITLVSWDNFTLINYLINFGRKSATCQNIYLVTIETHLSTVICHKNKSQCDM